MTGKVAGGTIHQLVIELIAIIGAPLAPTLLVLDIDPGKARQLFDRLHKVEILVLLDKVDRRAMSTAAKTHKGLAARTDHKGRALFLMERAQAGIIGARALELAVRVDQLDDINAWQQAMLNKVT